MLFDPESDPEACFIAASLPLPPDAEFAREQCPMGVIAQKRNFCTDYDTLDDPSTLRDRATVQLARHASFPSQHAIDCAVLQLDREEAIRRTGVAQPLPEGDGHGSGGAAAAGSGRSAVTRNKSGRLTTQAAIMAHEARQDLVMRGPERLYREPRCLTPCSHVMLENVPAAAVPSRSLPMAMHHRDVMAFANSYGLRRARRDCMAALLAIAAQCDNADGRYVDASFFPASRSALYPNGTPPDSSVAEPRNVARLSDLFPAAPIMPPLDCDETQFAVPMGCRSTQLVAAAAALEMAGLSASATLVVPPGEDPTAFVRRVGAIGACVCVDGAWEWVVIDDLVPTDALCARPLMLEVASALRLAKLQGCVAPWLDQNPATNAAASAAAAAKATTSTSFSVSTARSAAPSPVSPTRAQRGGGYLSPYDIANDPLYLAPYLLQKAHAKMHGCYAAIDGGCPRRAMEHLSGGLAASLIIPPGDTTMAAFDAFDSHIEGNAVLAHLRTSDPFPKGEGHAPSGTVFAPQAMPPSWVPLGLPLVVLGCRISDVDASPVVDLRSPFGYLSDGCDALTLQWEDFVRAVDRCDVLRAVSDEHVYVEGCDVTGRAPRFYVDVATPLPTVVNVAIIQSEPLAHTQLPLDVRLRLPYVRCGWSMLEVDPLREGAHRHRQQQSHNSRRGDAAAGSGRREVLSMPMVADRSCAADVRLSAGRYMIVPRFDANPSVPFALRVSATSLVTLSLWREGESKEVSGVHTLRRAPELAPLLTAGVAAGQVARGAGAPLTSLGGGPSPHTDAVGGSDRDGATVPVHSATADCAAASFGATDIAQRGFLDQRGVERAMAHFFLQHMPAGRPIATALEEALARPGGGGKVTAEEFAAILSQHISSDSVVPIAASKK